MQPKTYDFEKHLISPEKIDKHAYYVIEKLKASGHLAYLVGGSVRDLLLKERPKDFDISTSAKPEEIKKIFKRNCILIGRRFRLAHVRFGRKIIEVSTFRAGDTEDSSLIIHDNIWGTPEEDVLRRDFTINGLFYDTEKQLVIDYVGGFTDAKNKLLRTIGKAKTRFIQDPVRMLRLIKFKARFDFEIEKETLEALASCREEIKKSSPSRILEEVLRMLESGTSENFFKYLQKYNLLELLFPKISEKINSNKLIFPLLNQADIFVKKHYPENPDRSILLSCILYPLLDDRIKNIYDEKTNFHLGIIGSEAKSLIHDIFLPSFHLPKKIKAKIISIISNQFRFTPIKQHKKKRIRIPKDPFFNLSLKFFQLRCNLSLNLFKIYTKWNSELISFHQRTQKRHFIQKKKK